MFRRLLCLVVIWLVTSCTTNVSLTATPTESLAQLAPPTITATPTATFTHTPTQTFTPLPTRTPSPTPYPIILSPTPTLPRVTAAPEPSRELRRPTIDTLLLLPDLRMLPPTQLVIEVTPENERLLRFTTLIFNWGPGKLQVLGKSDATSARTVVMQHLYRANGAYDEHAAGIFLFHLTHKHWHVEDFARYEVWSLAADGEPKEIVALSDKISFCLRDTGRSSLEYAPLEPQYTQCEAELQGMSAGWIDAYEFDTPGQTVDVTALADGVYALNSIVDPSNRFQEADDTNNGVLIYFLLQKDTAQEIQAEQLHKFPDASQ